MRTARTHLTNTHQQPAQFSFVAGVRHCILSYLAFRASRPWLLPSIAARVRARPRTTHSNNAMARVLLSANTAPRSKKFKWFSGVREEIS